MKRLLLATALIAAPMLAHAADAPKIDPAKLAFYESLGLAWRNWERIGVTPQGMPLLDALLGELVPAALVAA